MQSEVLSQTKRREYNALTVATRLHILKKTAQASEMLQTWSAGLLLSILGRDF